MQKEKTFEKQLECFRRYQAVLANTVKEWGDYIDLDEISRSFIILEENTKLYIKDIPFTGDYVYLAYSNTEKKIEDRMEYSLSFLSASLLNELIERMRKCMIIVELRADSISLEDRPNIFNN